METTKQLKDGFSDPLSQNVDAELVYLLYSQAGAGIAGSLILATCVVLVMYNIIPTNILFTWYGIMVAIGLGRLGVIQIYLTKNPSVKKSHFWKNIFILIITFAGLIWGAATFLIPPHAVYQTFITCVLAGVSASAIPYFAGSRVACAAYIIPILLPFAVWSFFHIDTPHQVLGIFTIIYTLLLMFSSFKTHRAIYDAIKLKFENDELVRNLAIAKREAEHYLSTHDALTDLPNRSLFNTQMSQTLKRAQPLNDKVALLIMDLDHFKNINDTLGHQTGDHLLIKVVERTKECLRDIDTLARLGGDEFTIILENVTIEYVVSVAKKICQAFSIPFNLEGRDVFITTSIGISVYPDDGKDIQILLKNADMAIYRAKEHGRNTFEFYTHELNEKITKKLTIENHLRVALEKEEFQIHYQPIVDINKNIICGLEALIRWQHPQMGMVPPINFIPVAEEAGLIVPIGEWIIQSVCKHNVDWQKAGLDKQLRTSINLSARQFKEKNLAETITRILAESSVNGESLTLELTETLIMHDIEYSIRVIKALKELGIAISIDDFGTGYSSLNYLRKFPIDVLKIDRSFITELPTSSEDVSIVSAIIAMAHSLKMKVVAEGVETFEQYQFLKAEGCDEVQGHIFSKAIPHHEITSLLHDATVVSKRLNIN